MEATVVCAARKNVPLTPISFLQRSAAAYPDRIAIVASGRWSTARTWRETWVRCVSLAAALVELGVARHDVVAVFAQNIPAVCELHFGIPMAGAVICALNSRLDAAMACTLLTHSEAKVIFVDSVLLGVALEALTLMSTKAGSRRPLLVLIKEVLDTNPAAPTVPTDDHHYEYEALVNNTGAPSPRGFSIRWPADENDPIALNYTSGTTSRPKGVVYSHRGAYLNSIASVLMHDMHGAGPKNKAPVYLWTVPMFHCNGWCLVWGVAAKGGTNVCLRRVTAAGVFDAIARHGVTHMGGAPTVLAMIAAANEERSWLPLPAAGVTVKAGGAPPPPQVLLRMEALGFHVIHGYGLTETYGPATVCAWKPDEWDALPPEQRARLKSRQGVPLAGGLEEVDVKDPATMRSVPADGRTVGEVMLRGNTVMRGYYKDVAATAEALAGGWLRSGDLAVRDAGDGYVRFVDRAKDVVVSGGENVSTVEVEAALFAHPDVAEAAVVGRPDEFWGETPCAFVVRLLRDGGGAVPSVSAEEIMEFCRTRLPRYMAPRTVVFVEELPKTPTGKVQKVLLRERAKAMGSISGDTSSKRKGKGGAKPDSATRSKI